MSKKMKIVIQNVNIFESMIDVTNLLRSLRRNALLCTEMKKKSNGKIIRFVYCRILTTKT